MELLPFTFEQTLVRRILHKDMLETIDGGGRCPVLEDEFLSSTVDRGHAQALFQGDQPLTPAARARTRDL